MMVKNETTSSLMRRRSFGLVKQSSSPRYEPKECLRRRLHYQRHECHLGSTLDGKYYIAKGHCDVLSQLWHPLACLLRFVTLSIVIVFSWNK